MKAIENLLINGCSFSRGPGSWPYYLNCKNLVNLAQAGAGNTYIHETTVSELSQRCYDFVVIMWTGIYRIDVQVSNIDDFSKSKYTSHYQHQQNDWPGKIVYPINDQDYVEKNWVFGCGHVNQELAMKQTKLFDGLYKYVGHVQFRDSLLIKMISLQNTLKQMQIPYLFSLYTDYNKQLQTNANLYNLLDQKHMYTKQNINTIAVNNQWFDQDGVHPGVQAHKTWAEIITIKIEELYEAN